MRGQRTAEKLRSETCLGIGRSDPDAIRILDDVLSQRAVKTKKSTWSERVVPFGRLGEEKKDALRTIELHRCNCRDGRGAPG
jgi:hypothetical protein